MLFSNLLFLLGSFLLGVNTSYASYTPDACEFPTDNMEFARLCPRSCDKTEPMDMSRQIYHTLSCRTDVEVLIAKGVFCPEWDINAVSLACIDAISSVKEIEDGGKPIEWEKEDNAKLLAKPKHTLLSSLKTLEFSYNHKAADKKVLDAALPEHKYRRLQAQDTGDLPPSIETQANGFSSKISMVNVPQVGVILLVALASLLGMTCIMMISVPTTYPSQPLSLHKEY